MSRRKTFTGGLFDGRGKPQPLRVSKSAQQIITPEKQIQEALIRWRDMFKGQYPILNALFACPNGIWAQNKAVAAAAVRQGLTRGISDIICLAPSADGKYHALLIELKNEVGKESDDQIFFREFFAGLGYRTEVCRSWWEAGRIVNEHLGIKVPVYSK
jgi:hypothetical protein